MAVKKMTPERKKELEAQLQKLAEAMCVEALRHLGDSRMELSERMSDFGLTINEEYAASQALQKFFSDVADGLARNWGYEQNPRVKI